MSLAVKRVVKGSCSLEGLLTESIGKTVRVVRGNPGETPILRWAGSKKRLLPHLIAFSQKSCRRYFEPFLGSGALFLGLGPNKAILSDNNPDLINVYKQAQTNSRALWESVITWPESDDFYYKLRAANTEQWDDFDRACRFLYLNRYCFNGVYRTNQLGEFNVAKGTGYLGIPDWDTFHAFACKLESAQILESDFESIINRAGERDFVYLDPPYIDLSKRDRGEYGINSFKHNDLSRLAKAARLASLRGANVLISYRYSEEIMDLLPGWNVSQCSVRRSVAGSFHKRIAAQEIVLSNYTYQ